MRIGVIGSGSLGSLFAAFLSTKVDVVLLGHWSDQIATLKKYGLTVIQLDGTSSQYHFPVIEDPLTIPPVDIALVLVKSYQTSGAAVEARSLLTKRGLAITLQNGLGNYEILSSALGADRVIQGVTSLGANMVKPGIVRHAGEGNTYFALPSKDEILLSQISTIFNESGFQTEITPNLAGLQWGKLAVNSAINPLTALLNVPNGFLHSNKIAQHLAFETAEETARVAEALGISLPYSSAGGQALAVAEATADNRSSMLQDIGRGAPTEIGAICGQVVRHGRDRDIETPLNSEFLRLLSSNSDKIKSGKLQSTLIPLNELLSIV